jgi:hypothetical protein
LGSLASSIGAQCASRKSLPCQALDRGSTMPAACTVPRKAGAPPSTQAPTTLRSASVSNPTCGAASSAVTIGARGFDGNVAGAAEDDTHAIVPRKEVALHPAAGVVSPWQATHRARRMGATSVS